MNLPTLCSLDPPSRIISNLSKIYNKTFYNAINSSRQSINKVNTFYIIQEFKQRRPQNEFSSNIKLLTLGQYCDLSLGLHVKCSVNTKTIYSATTNLLGKLLVLGRHKIFYSVVTNLIDSIITRLKHDYFIFARSSLPV